MKCIISSLLTKVYSSRAALLVYLLLWSLCGSESASAYPFERHVRAASARHGVEAPLLRAIVKAESDFDQYAVSSKGALGLAQLLLTTARQYEPRVSRFQLRQEADLNIDIGARHLKVLERRIRRRYPQLDGLERIRLIAAAYNAGWSRVMAAGGTVPPIRETRNYCRKVVSLYRSYGGKYKPAIRAATAQDDRSRPWTEADLPNFTELGEQAPTFGLLSILLAAHVLINWSRLVLLEGKL